MHVGALLISEGPAPDYDELLDTIRGRLHLVPRYRQKLVRPAARDRAPAVGRRPDVQPRVPRAPHRAAAARAPRSSSCAWPRGSSPSSSTAPSRCGRCGSSRASRTAASRCISKTHHALIDGIAGRRPRAGPLRPRAPTRRPPTTTGLEAWSPSREPSPAELLVAAGRAASSRTGVDLAAARGRRCAATRARRCGWRARRRRGHRRDRLGRPQPRARDAAERRDRPAPPLRGRPPATSPTSSASRTRSAARSTTSCSPSSAARCATWLRSRGVRTEGLELRALVPVSIRVRRRARRARQPDRRDARAAAGVHRGPGRAPATSVTRRWTASRSPSRPSAPRSCRNVQNFAPPTVLAQASRLNFSTRLFNLHRHERPRAAVPALRARAASCTTSSRSRSCPRTTRWPIAIMSYDGGLELRPARRLRRAARHRADRRGHRGRRWTSCKAARGPGVGRGRRVRRAAADGGAPAPQGLGALGAGQHDAGQAPLGQAGRSRLGSRAPLAARPWRPGLPDAHAHDVARVLLGVALGVDAEGVEPVAGAEARAEAQVPAVDDPPDPAGGVPDPAGVQRRPGPARPRRRRAGRCRRRSSAPQHAAGAPVARAVQPGLGRPGGPWPPPRRGRRPRRGSPSRGRGSSPRRPVARCP